MLTPDEILEKLKQAERLWLFLDYDGTLADFAPTPDHIHPDPEVADLISHLSRQPHIRLAVVSGRRLKHVRALIPVPGVLLAGTYGIELRTPEGEQVERVAYEQVRPLLERLKPRWAGLLAGHEGFFLEDKDWALAIHARFADEGQAEKVLDAAQQVAAQVAQEAPPGLFRLLGGHKFLEIAPTLGHKGRTVNHLLERYPWPGALSLYLGDDDKDEEAFEVIQQHGGLAVVVAPEPPEDTQADFWLASPQAARRWLRERLLPQNKGVET